MTSAAAVLQRHQALFGVDDAWVASHREEIIEPDLAIVDPHHHLWDRGAPYLLNEMLADTGSGHDIRATVFVQCDSMYRAGGDPDFAPLGETEFVNGIAAMSASGAYGPTRIAAGIVGFAELRLGERVDAVLEAHVQRAESASRASAAGRSGMPTSRSRARRRISRPGCCSTRISAAAMHGWPVMGSPSIHGYSTRRYWSWRTAPGSSRIRR
jgi:hypothetical protein